jgi:hypothetical protein
MSLERRQAKAREHQQTGRSLSAWPVRSGGTRSHSLCRDPPYRTTTVTLRLAWRPFLPLGHPGCRQAIKLRSSVQPYLHEPQTARFICVRFARRFEAFSATARHAGPSSSNRPLRGIFAIPYPS